MRVCGICKNTGVVNNLHNWTTGGKRSQACWQCYEETTGVVMDGLRNLRLTHWLHAVKLAQEIPHTKTQETRDKMKRQQGHHMRAVQILNDLFPIGDTAEQEAAK